MFLRNDQSKLKLEEQLLVKPLIPRINFNNFIKTVELSQVQVESAIFLNTRDEEEILFAVRGSG